MIYKTDLYKYRVVKGRFFYRAQFDYINGNNWRHLSGFHLTKNGAFNSILAAQKRVVKFRERIKRRQEKENTAVEV